MGLFEPCDTLRRCALRMGTGVNEASSLRETGGVVAIDGRLTALVADRRASLRVGARLGLTGSAVVVEDE